MTRTPPPSPLPAQVPTWRAPSCLPRLATALALSGLGLAAGPAAAARVGDEDYLRWDEMSAQQQAMVREQYDALPAGDEPPWPLNGRYRQLTTFRQLAARSLRDGELVVVVTVDADGVPQKARVFKTPDAEVGTAMAAQLMKDKYKPGKCHGQPCRMDYLFEMDVQVGAR